MRRSLITVAAVLTTVLAAAFSPDQQPSSGQQREGWTPCGCFCGFEPPYPPVPPVQYTIFNSQPCTGIISADACREGLSSLPAAELASVCEKVKASKNFKSFKETCPVFAQFCPDEGKPPDRSDRRSNVPSPSSSPSPDEKPCKADNVTLEVSRSSLIQTSSTGNPEPGSNPAFKYTANPSSAATYTTSDANANPNTGDLKAPPNPTTTGEPSPGALAELTVSYTCEGGGTVTKKFNVATFGLSCYVLADENDWILPAPAPSPTPSATPTPSPTASPSPAPSPTETPSPTPTPAPTLNCKSQRISGTRYSGVTTNPTGLPPGDYCTSFLADVRLQGSGTSRDGTKVKYVSGNNPNWVFKTVTEFTGFDGKPLIVNGSVARDRAIIGGRGTTIVKLERGDFVANDTGGAIRGYRLDVFGGTGQNACRSFPNRIEVGACDPPTNKCPELKSPIP